MIDIKHWTNQADRIGIDSEYTYESLALDLVDRLGWTTAVDLAAAIRGHVYGTPSYSQLHTDARPIYDALGWEQAALLAAWFRDSRNWPGRKRTGQRLTGGWPAAAKPHTTH